MTPASPEISPFFDNLFEGKAVYRERYIYLVRLKEVEITSGGFSATAIPLLDMTPEILAADFPNFGCEVRTEPWCFGGIWDFVWLYSSKGPIGSPYVSWFLWTEPGLVRAMETLARAGCCEQALKLLEASWS